MVESTGLISLLISAAFFCGRRRKSSASRDTLERRLSESGARYHQIVHVQAYSFTSRAIARALSDAEERGVKVTAILDASNRTKKYSAADFLAHEGVETYIDS